MPAPCHADPWPEINANDYQHVGDLSLSKMEAILTPARHQGKVLAAAFSPDGRTVLTGSEDGTAWFWDARIGQPIGPPPPRKARALPSRNWMRPAPRTR